MSTLYDIFGHGKDLTPLQMSARAIVIFIAGLVLIRIAGRRAFGQKTPFDSVISILLGAILSRAVVGASPFIATVVASTAIVVMHRLFATLGFYSDAFGKLVKGESKILYKDGKMHKDHMRTCMITKKDMEESVRLNSNLQFIEEAAEVYAERDGQISVIKKKEER